MTCGRKSRTGVWLGLALLCLCSGLSFGQSYDGPELPEGWLAYHETEIAELDATFDRLEKRAIEREQLLTIALQQTSEALEQSAKAKNSQQQTSKILTRVEASLLVAERAVGRLRSLSIVLGVTASGGVLFILFTLFGNAPVIGD